MLKTNLKRLYNKLSTLNFLPRRQAGKLPNAEGLTLVEILVVAALLVILISGLIVLIDPLKKIALANDAKRKSELAQLQRALEIYYQDHQQYPTSSGTYKIIDVSERNWGTSWSPYMSILPKDPSDPTLKYVYFSPANGQCANNQCYYLYANLQRGANDPNSCNGGLACASLGTAGFPPANACLQTCNYGVTSPNMSPNTTP